MKQKAAAANTKGRFKAYLGLGSNLDDRESNLETALKEIEKLGKLKEKSAVYESEPVGYKEQRDFLNMVLKIETDLTPLELIIRIKEIEHKMGREKTFKFGPRIIDIDILFYEDWIITGENLKIPHPGAHKRNFVLTPLSEIAEKFVHPVLNKTIMELKNNLLNPDKVKIWKTKKSKN